MPSAYASAMLYLHCGWPHTGTSSFQAAMFEHREALAAAGIVYPDGWRRRNPHAHHGILDLIESSTAGVATLDDFKEYLRANRDRTVLISSELLTEGLIPSKGRGSLLWLVESVRQVTPVTCLWTLRCMADVLVAIYHSQFVKGWPEPSGPVLGRAQWRAVLQCSHWYRRPAGMRELAAALGQGIVYSRYDGEQGTHYDELLGAIGVPDPLREEIATALRRGPRINTRITRKTAVALLRLDAVSERAGVELSWNAVRIAWRDGILRFADDSPCVLIDPEVRRAAHEEMMKACQDAGWDPYVEYFQDVEIDPTEPPTLDPEILTEADLEQLTAL